MDTRCQTRAQRFADHALGTRCTFDIRRGHCPQFRADQALRRAAAHLHRVDEVLSTARPDSPMSRLRRDEITLAQAPPEVAEVLWCCADARRRSGGAFDPWAGQGGVDPSGLLRGWAVAGALDILARSGMRAALIDAGGVVGAFGGPGPARGWSVAVPAPSGTGGRAGWVVENAQAVATVGSPQGPGGGWATVVGPDPALAEALAAGVLAAGGDLGVLDRAPGYRGLWAGPDGALRVGAGFPGAPWGAVARPRHAVAAA